MASLRDAAGDAASHPNTADDAEAGGRRGVQPPLRQKAPPLSWQQRVLRKALPTKLWNTRYETLCLGAESLLRRGTLDFFQVVEVESTTACNRRCSYCPNSSHDRGLLKNERRMSDELFQTLLRQLADLRFTGRISPHFYGEPLIDERLEAWIAECRRVLPLAKVVVFTNGDYLNVERYLSLLEAGLDGLLVTQHSKKQLKGVEAVLEYRKRHGKAGLQMDYRKFTATTELSNRGGLVEHEHLETKTDCKSPTDNVTIDHAGNVILCCNDYSSSVKFGNIADEHLAMIWQKADYKRLRRELRQGHFELEICQRCAAGEAGVAPLPDAKGKRQLAVL